MPDNHVVIFCTVPDPESGRRIARHLVEEKLAACVNLLPGAVSIYRWQEKLEEAQECLLLIKTRGARVPEVQARIGVLHPYEVPEIVALPIVAGSDKYLIWLTENTQ